MSTEQKSMDASVVFQTYHNEQGEYDPFARLRQDIERVDIATDTMQFRSAPFMGLVDLAYTALFVYFFKPFFSTLLSEAAKDSYPRIKKGTRELWGKIFGSTIPPQESLLTADGPKTTKFSIKFSLWATINEGRVKLLFPVECGQKEFERATELFLDLMMSYHAGIVLQRLSLDDQKNRFHDVVCVYYDKTTDELKVLHPDFHRKGVAIEKHCRLDEDEDI